MGRLIKYELKKQQTSRNIILALLLVFFTGICGRNFFRQWEYGRNQYGTGDFCWNVCLLLYGN